jgi:hypothetical protein
VRNTTLPAESKKSAEKGGRVSGTQSEITETQTNPVVKAQSKIRETYQEVVEAQKDLQNAVKDREKENREAYKEAEEKYRAYKTALDNAFLDRVAAEQAAIEKYQKSTDNARAIYAGAMKKALLECKNSTEQARDILAGIQIQQKTTSSSGPVLFTLRIKKPNFEGLKTGITNSKDRLRARTAALIHKIQRPPAQPAAESIESIPE